MTGRIEWTEATPGGSTIFSPGVFFPGYEEPTTEDINVFVTGNGEDGAMLSGSRENVLAWLEATAAAVRDFIIEPHFLVRYRVLTGVDGSTVSENEISVAATTVAEANIAAVSWAHQNDPHADPRLDPRVVVDHSEQVGS